MFAEGIRDMIFDTETIVVLLGCALIDKAFVVRTEAMKFFIAAIAQGALHCFRGGIHSKMFAEGVRDKIFDTKTVAALRFALVDEDSVVEAVKFFIAAIAQGVVHCFRGIFLLKCLQRAFGTRYSTSRPSMYL